MKGESEMPTVGKRYRYLIEAGQLGSYIHEMEDAIRAYMAARDRVDHRLIAPNYKDPNSPILFRKTKEEIERLYEELRTFI